jgi:hypothetical protein
VRKIESIHAIFILFFMMKNFSKGLSFIVLFIFLFHLNGEAQDPQCAGLVQYTVTLSGGSYADERGYKIVDSNGALVYFTGEQGGPVAQGGTGCAISPNAATTALVSLREGKNYTIIGYDCYGDGWNNGQLRIRRSSDNAYILGTVSSGVTFTSSTCTGGCYQQVGGNTARWNFTTLGIAVCGCTDEIACNYESDMVYNDGTCSYTGCMDAAACNYLSCATIAGLCEYTSCVGCQD